MELGVIMKIIMDSLLKGKLYNWYAVNSHRGIDSTGWQIPFSQRAIELLRTVGVNFD